MYVKYLNHFDSLYVVHVLSIRLFPIYKLVDVNEVKLIVESMTFNELVNFLKEKKHENVIEIDICNERKHIVLKDFDKSIIPISYLPIYVFCPYRLVNAVKLAQEFGYENKLVKIVDENQIRKFVFGDLLHDYYIKKLVEKYGEDVVQYEVYVERNVLNKFVLRGRCDIISIVDNELSVIELKTKIYKEPHEIQLSAYGHCLDTKSLYLIDVRNIVKIERVKWKYVREIALKIHEIFKKNFEVVKKDLEIYKPSFKKCKQCAYAFICEIRKKIFPDITSLTL